MKREKEEKEKRAALTQRDVLGVEAAPHQVAHHEPEVGHAGVAPRRAQLALLVQAPHRLDLRRRLLA